MNKNESQNKRIFLSPPDLRGNEQKYVKEAFELNYIAPLGPMVDRFEEKFAEKVENPHTLALNTGTAALHLALKIMGVKAKDKVICSTLTFIGGVSPVTFLGAEPIFVDSELISWNMDPQLLEKAIESEMKKGAKPKVIILTHIYGVPAQLDKINEIANRYHIPVIEDCAEALGAQFQGKPLGSNSKAALFSFNGNKIITTSGGGMLVANNKEFIDKAIFYSTQAREKELHYEHLEIGYNYRMSSILAAIGLGQLESLDEKISIRKRNYEFYKQELNLPGISFIPDPSYGRSNYWLTCILLDPAIIKKSPAEICIELDKKNIETRPTWKSMHMQPVFRDATRYINGTAEMIFKRGLCLPSGSQMTTEDLERVVGELKECLK